MISLQHIAALKSGKQTFHDFTWTLRDNEHWVVSGSNGSGKTTLLELLSGKLSVTNGSVEGMHAAGSERNGDVIYIPAHATDQWIKGTEFYYQQRYYSLGDEYIPTVADVMEIAVADEFTLPKGLDVRHLLHLRINRLSNGQLKKALLLKHLIGRSPSLLLWDYPFEGLDYASRQDLCDFLDAFVKEGNVQLVIVDNFHSLPTVINRRLVLESFCVQREEHVVPQKSAERKFRAAANIESSGEPIIEMRGVSIKYGDTIILNNVHWKISRGERWALTGKNGSGKTTLFSLMYGDHPMAYSNPIWLFGRKRGTGESIWQIKNRMAYLGPELMVNLASSGQHASVGAFLLATMNPPDQEELTGMANQFNAAPLLEKSIRALSSGEKQLVLLMQCFIEDKEVYLLDEPFQFLDIEKRNLVSNYLQEHMEEGKTLILITHHAEDIEAWTKLTYTL